MQHVMGFSLLQWQYLCVVSFSSLFSTLGILCDHHPFWVGSIGSN